MDSDTDTEARVMSQSRLFSNITLNIASVIGSQRQRLGTFGEWAAAGLERARLTRAAYDLNMNMQELPESGSTNLRVVEDACDTVLVSLEDRISENILDSVSGVHERASALLDQDLAVNPADKKQLPKLHALARMRQSLEDTKTDFREEDSAIGEQLAPYIRVDHFLDGKNVMKPDWDQFESRIASGFNYQADYEGDSKDADELTEDEITRLSQAEKFSRAIENLFVRLESCFKSCCTSPHETRMHLSDLVQVQLDFQVAGATQPNVWCRSNITDYRYRTAKGPFEYRQNLDKLGITLCDTITTSARLRKELHFTFESQGLWRPSHKIGTSIYTAAVRKLSFPQILVPGLKFSKASKRRLLAELARALLLLLGTSWWTENNLVSDCLFINHDPNSLEYPRDQALYIYRLIGIPDAGKYKEPIHGTNHPVLLEYALLLLQIETGKEYRPTEDDCDLFTGEFSPYVMLQRLLDEEREEVSVKCRRIGEVCLEFDSYLRRFSAQNADFEDSFRTKAVIYKRIYKPLLETIRYDFPVEATGLDLPDWPPTPEWPNTSSRLMEVSHALNDIRLTKQTENPTEAQSSWAGSHMVHAPFDLHAVNSIVHQTQLKPGLLLFDVDTTVHAGRTDYAMEFFKHHQRFLNKHIRRSGAQSRVKIAVLDTGVDRDNPEIRGLLRNERFNGHDPVIVETVSFDGASADDTDGHGTHTASLLMKVAPHANLYIAKIASAADESIDGLKNVIQGIRWAMEKRVDIISMSFGFPNRSIELVELSDQIEAAYKADIILLAAASNTGGNGQRAYPASDAYVMCIHAVDGLGNNFGGFNPSAVEGQDNFATLGIGIDCVWNEQRCSRSGTSYATPIAAGFAANVLEYAMYYQERGYLEPTTYRRLRKPFGMRQTFRLMADERERGSGYLWVRPWKFWRESSSYSWICESLERALGL